MKKYNLNLGQDFQFTDIESYYFYRVEGEGRDTMFEGNLAYEFSKNRPSGKYNSFNDHSKYRYWKFSALPSSSKMTKNSNGAYVEHSQFPSFIKELKIDNFFDIFTGPLIAAGDDSLVTQPTLIMTNDGLIVSFYKYNFKESGESATNDSVKCEIIDILDGSGSDIDLDINDADISELVYADFSTDFFTEKYGYLLRKENISISTDDNRTLLFKNKKIYGKGGVTYFTCDGDSEAAVDEYGDYRLSDSNFKETADFVYLSKKMNYKISDHENYEIFLVGADNSEDKLIADSDGIFRIPRYSTLIDNPGKCFKIRIKLAEGAEISDIRIR